MKSVTDSIRKNMETIEEESRVILERKQQIREYLSLLEEEWIQEAE